MTKYSFPRTRFTKSWYGKGVFDNFKWQRCFQNVDEVYQKTFQLNLRRTIRKTNLNRKCSTCDNGSFYSNIRGFKESFDLI